MTSSASALDPRTALVVVDVQNDFADPAGSLFVQDAARVVERASQEARLASEAGAFVVYTQDWHPGTTPHFAKDGGIWPVHCVGGTWGADFHPGLAVLGPAVRKGANGEDGYSGFTMRDPVSAAAALPTVTTSSSPPCSRARRAVMTLVRLAGANCLSWLWDHTAFPWMVKR